MAEDGAASIVWEAPPSLPSSLFDVFDVSTTPSRLPLPPSLPLPCGLLQRAAVADWKRRARERAEKDRKQTAAASARSASMDALSLSLSVSTTALASLPPPDRLLAERIAEGPTSPWADAALHANGDGGAVDAVAEARRVGRKRRRATLDALQVSRVPSAPPHPPCSSGTDGRCPISRALCCASQVHLRPERAAASWAARCAAWDPLALLQPSLPLRALSAPPSAAALVSFASRVAYALLELDAEHALVTTAAERAPASFADNAARPAAAMFLTYADLSGCSERGAITEFIQWRRRSCELRARGWGMAITAPALHDDRSGAVAEASDPPPSSLWRLSSMTPLAREQSRKNFTALPSSTGVAAFVARVQVDTKGEGVQLLVGASPEPEAAEEEAAALSTRPASVLCAELLTAACAAFGLLRAGGDFCFRLRGVTERALADSPLLLSLLHVLAGTFDRLHVCRTAVRAWGVGECWLVAKAFRCAQRSGRGAAEPLAAARSPPPALPYHHALLALVHAVRADGGFDGCERWGLGTAWREDGRFRADVDAAWDAVADGERADCARLALRPATAAHAVGAFRTPNSAERALSAQRTLREAHLDTALR